MCHAVVGEPVLARYIPPPASYGSPNIRWTPPAGASAVECDDGLEMQFNSTGNFLLRATVPKYGSHSHDLHLTMRQSQVTEAPARRITGGLQVKLAAQQAANGRRMRSYVGIAIRDRTCAISFERYRKFLNRVLLWEENEKLPEPIERRLRDLGAHLRGTGAYQLLKLATEVFLLLECGVRIGHDQDCQFNTTSLGTFQGDTTPQSGNDPGQLAEK